MSEISIRSTAGTSRQAASNDQSGQKALNDGMAVALVLFAALAPVPLGSNRAFMWGLCAAIVGILATIYAAGLLQAGSDFRHKAMRLRAVTLLFAAMCIWLVVQALPLGSLLAPFTFTTRLGDTIQSQTLSLAPGSTWLMLIRQVTYALFFFLMLQVAANRGRARTLTNLLLYVIAAHAAYGLVALTYLGDTLLFFEKWAYQGWATGTFVNRNSYATFLAFGLLLGVSQLMRAFVSEDHEKGARRFLEGISAAAIPFVLSLLILAAIFATGSRMGLFAGLGGVVAVVILTLLKAPKRGGFGAVAALVLSISGGVAALYGGGLAERLADTAENATGRIDLYSQVLDLILANPLTGYGGGSFEVAFPMFHTAPVSPDVLWDKAHNTYLTLWSELGVIGGSIPMLILALIAFDAFRVYRRRERDWMAPATTLGVIVIGALHSLVDFSLEMQANTIMFLAIIALGVGRRERRSQTEEEAPLPHAVSWRDRPTNLEGFR